MSTLGYGSAAVSVIGRGTIRLVWRVRAAGERTRVSWLMPWFTVPFEGPCDRMPSAMRIAQHAPSLSQAGAPDSAWPLIEHPVARLTPVRPRRVCDAVGSVVE